MKFKIFVLISFIGYASISLAQSRETIKKIDSLLFKTSKLLIQKKFNEALKKSKTSLSLSEKNNYAIGQQMALYRMAQCYDNLGKIKESIQYADNAIFLATKNRNDSIKLFCNLIKGVQYGKMGWNDKAITIINQCLKETDCIIYSDRRHLFKGALFDFKAYVILQSNSNPPYKELMNYYMQAMHEYSYVIDKCENPGYNNVGMCYFQLKQYDEAKKYYKMSIEFEKEKKKINLSK